MIPVRLPCSEATVDTVCAALNQHGFVVLENFMTRAWADKVALFELMLYYKNRYVRS